MASSAHDLVEATPEVATATDSVPTPVTDLTGGRETAVQVVKRPVDAYTGRLLERALRRILSQPVTRLLRHTQGPDSRQGPVVTETSPASGEPTADGGEGPTAAAAAAAEAPAGGGATTAAPETAVEQSSPYRMVLNAQYNTAVIDLTQRRHVGVNLFCNVAPLVGFERYLKVHVSQVMLVKTLDQEMTPYAGRYVEVDLDIYVERYSESLLFLFNFVWVVLEQDYLIVTEDKAYPIYSIVGMLLVDAKSVTAEIAAQTAALTEWTATADRFAHLPMFHPAARGAMQAVSAQLCADVYRSIGVFAAARGQPGDDPSFTPARKEADSLAATYRALLGVITAIDEANCEGPPPHRMAYEDDREPTVTALAQIEEKLGAVRAQLLMLVARSRNAALRAVYIENQQRAEYVGELGYADHRKREQKLYTGMRVYLSEEDAARAAKVGVYADRTGPEPFLYTAQFERACTLYSDTFGDEFIVPANSTDVLTESEPTEWEKADAAFFNHINMTKEEMRERFAQAERDEAAAAADAETQARAQAKAARAAAAAAPAPETLVDMMAADAAVAPSGTPGPRAPALKAKAVIAPEDDAEDASKSEVLIKTYTGAIYVPVAVEVDGQKQLVVRPTPGPVGLRHQASLAFREFHHVRPAMMLMQQVRMLPRALYEGLMVYGTTRFATHFLHWVPSDLGYLHPTERLYELMLQDWATARALARTHVWIGAQLRILLVEAQRKWQAMRTVGEVLAAGLENEFSYETVPYRVRVCVYSQRTFAPGQAVIEGDPTLSSMVPTTAIPAVRTGKFVFVIQRRDTGALAVLREASPSMIERYGFYGGHYVYASEPEYLAEVAKLGMVPGTPDCVFDPEPTRNRTGRKHPNPYRLSPAAILAMLP